MAIRLTVRTAGRRTVIQVDGRLAGEAVDELESTCRMAAGSLVLDLANLATADDTGVLTLRRLVSERIALVGVSPYVALLIGRPAARPASAARLVRPAGGGPGRPPRATCKASDSKRKRAERL